MFVYGMVGRVFIKLYKRYGAPRARRLEKVEGRKKDFLLSKPKRESKEEYAT